MDGLFKNRYRIDSTRLKGWDYSSNGCYFVTICVKDRRCVFGNVEDGRMVLTEIGCVADKCWVEIPDHFPFVKLYEHIVMPNHVHGIIVIDKPVVSVETQNIASLQIPQPNQFGPQSQNLGSIVRGYKIGVKKWATIHNVAFEWQPRYYDSIIRNERDLSNVRNYIVDNPLNWKENEGDVDLL